MLSVEEIQISEPTASTTAGVHVTVTSEHVAVTSPFCSEWVDAARALGGTWWSLRREWRFDLRIESRVRTALAGVYGTDGTSVPAMTILVNVTGLRSLSFAGLDIAVRPYRDAAVRLGPGVSVATGCFPQSGGSGKHPSIATDEGTIVEVRDIPAALLDQIESRPWFVRARLAHEEGDRPWGIGTIAQPPVPV